MTTDDSALGCVRGSVLTPDDDETRAWLDSLPEADRQRFTRVRRIAQRKALDKEFGAVDAQAALDRVMNLAIGPPPIYGDTYQVLSWIRHRCPEKLDAINASNMRRVFWYGGDSPDRCDRALRRELVAGTIVAIAESGLELPAAAWAFVGANQQPNVRIRWADVHRVWPAAFLGDVVGLVAQSLQPRSPIDETHDFGPDALNTRAESPAEAKEEVLSADARNVRSRIFKSKILSAAEEAGILQKIEEVDVKNTTKKKEIAIIWLIKDGARPGPGGGMTYSQFAAEVHHLCFPGEPKPTCSSVAMWNKRYTEGPLAKFIRKVLRGDDRLKALMKGRGDDKYRRR